MRPHVPPSIQLMCRCKMIRFPQKTPVHLFKGVMAKLIARRMWYPR